MNQMNFVIIRKRDDTVECVSNLSITEISLSEES